MSCNVLLFKFYSNEFANATDSQNYIHSFDLFIISSIVFSLSKQTKTMIRVVCYTAPQPISIKTITQILPLSQNHIILLGHSTDSLKRLEIVYEIYDVDTKQTIRVGKISKFGVIFLTNYVNYDKNCSFLALVTVMGTRRIVKQDFQGVEARTIIREVKMQQFKERATSERLSLYYSPTSHCIYLLEQLQFGEDQHQMIVRIYAQGVEVGCYRIISLEQIPSLIWSPQYFVLALNREVTIYKNNFEPTYFTLQNMEQFNILGFYKDFILQLKQNLSIFTMSLSGVIRPLLEEAVYDYHFTPQILYFLLQNKAQCLMSVKVFRIGTEGIKYQEEIQNVSGSKIRCANGEQLILNA